MRSSVASCVALFCLVFAGCSDSAQAPPMDGLTTDADGTATDVSKDRGVGGEDGRAPSDAGSGGPDLGVEVSPVDGGDDGDPDDADGAALDARDVAVDPDDADGTAPDSGSVDVPAEDTDDAGDTPGGIDECLSGTHTCDINATCVDTDDSYVCTCNNGFSGDGFSCVDIDECATNNGGCSQLCSNFEGDFGCCPPEPSLPATTGCDGVVLTAAENIETQTSGIVEGVGPGGAPALVVGNGESMDLVDAGCLQLGADGQDFSVSMWLKASGGSQIIGTKTQYNGNQGFVVFTTVRSDGQLELRARSALASEQPSSTWRTVTSIPFTPDVWTHVAVTYRNDDALSTFTLHVNTAPTSGAAHPDVHNSDLRIGDQGWGDISPFEVSEMRSYGRLLTDAEVGSLFIAGAADAGFTTAPLLEGISALEQHVTGQALLDSAGLVAALTKFNANKVLLGTDAGALEAALDLIDAYEANSGPLFIGSETAGGFPREGTPGDSLALARAMLAVHQAMLDQGYSGQLVNGCRGLFEGRSWLTSTYFPGAAPQPEDPETLNPVTIRAEAPAFWGRPVAFAADPTLRPTGYYLPAGSLGRVVVPPELVGAGYRVRVGAHTADHKNKNVHKRLDRVSMAVPILAEDTWIVHPLGGGVYIEVPYLADEGLVEIHLAGVIASPFFSMRAFDTTTPEEWLVRREHPGPWADFETERFMMQVPRSWIYALDDPAELMNTWDTALDGVSELLGYPPEKRNKTVLYQQVDVHIRHGAFGIGYPQVNNTYNPMEDPGGFKDHWLLTDPVAFEVDYHELGHAQFMTMFPGETEAIVNFPHAYVRNVKFGVDFDVAFQQSFGPSYGDVGFKPDAAAIHWMLTENFRNGLPMDKSNTTKDQFRYQQRGYAKYADVARLFGWNALTDFWHQEHLDYMAATLGDGLSVVDSRILRMSVAAGADLTPLIHFWGIHPDDPAALQSAVSDAGLGPSEAIRDQLVTYAAIAPADNAAFLVHFDEVYPGMPTGGNPDYGVGWYNVMKDLWDEALYAELVAAIQALLDVYYPGTTI